MTNKVLFISSIVAFFIHSFLFHYFIYHFPNKWLFYACLLTSIWNHGTTNKIAKYMDRLLVFLCIIHNLSWLFFIEFCATWLGILIFTINGISFYFLSKIYDITLYHVYSHCCATISNFCLGIYFS